jgi:hypothetical protein
MDSETILCPSAPGHDGAILVGIVMRDGRVAFASDRIVVDREFMQIALEGRSPERRFRFGSACAKSGCAQWTGERCGVIDRAMDGAGPRGEPAELPECSIRPQCRWFNQAGATACAVCPEVITDKTVMFEDYSAEAATVGATP